MSPEQETIESLVILKCQANDLIKTVHDRMPVILEAEAWDGWLNNEVDDPNQIKATLLPLASNMMETYPVGLNVNNPGNDNPQCIIEV